MDNETILRSALGSMAQLGELYDAHRDIFPALSIFNKSTPPPTAIQTTDSNHQDTKYFQSDKCCDEFENLNVQPELKLSVLGGLVNLRGTAKSLENHKSSKRSARCSLVQNIITKYEQLNIYDKTLEGSIASNALHQAATHVVVGITWGATVKLAVECNNSVNENKTVIEGALEAYLIEATVQASGKAKLDSTKYTSLKNQQISYRIWGDVLPERDSAPTVEAAVQLVKKLPVLLKKANNGKGKPLVYTLLPLNVLASHLKIPLRAPIISRTLSEKDILPITHLFDDNQDIKQELHDLNTDLITYQDCLEDASINKAKALKRNVDIADFELRSQLKELVVEVRSGVKDASELRKLAQKFEQDDNSAKNTKHVMCKEFSEVQEKIKLLKFLAGKYHVKLVSKNESTLDVMLRLYPGRDVYMLFSKSEAQLEDNELRSKQFRLFVDLLDKQESSKSGRQQRAPVFLYVDLDVTPKLFPQGDQVNVVQQFRNGRCISTNLDNDLGKRLVKSSKTGEYFYCQEVWAPGRDGSYAEGSLVGGRDRNGDIEIVARVLDHNGGKLPGKLVPSKKLMYFPCFEQEHEVNTYETLVIPEDAVSWVKSGRGENLPNAIKGGTARNGDPLYVGRTKYQDHTVQVGKVHPEQGRLLISDLQKEIPVYRNYELLVYNEEIERSETRLQKLGKSLFSWLK